jgi:hypothetical protein
VKRYFDLFGRQQVHVVIFDDFARDTAAAYHDVLEFLGLEAPHREAGFGAVNGNRCAKHPWLQTVLTDRFVRSAALTLRPWIPERVFVAARSAQEKLVQINSRTYKRSPLDPEVHARLRREFAPEVERLSELLGRDLTHWSR